MLVGVSHLLFPRCMDDYSLIVKLNNSVEEMQHNIENLGYVAHYLKKRDLSATSISMIQGSARVF